MTYQQSVFKRHHSDKHFLEFYLQDGGKKSTGIDMEQNYVTVTVYIHPTALYHGTPHKATAITSECCKPPTNIGIVAVVYQIVPSSV